MNILGNSLIKKMFPNLNIFVEPIGSDSSQSLGAALYHYKRMFPHCKFLNLNTLYYGPQYNLNEIKQRVMNHVEQSNK